MTALSGREQKTERTLRGLHPSPGEAAAAVGREDGISSPSPTTFYLVVSNHLLPLGLQFPAFAMEMNNTVLSERDVAKVLLPWKPPHVTSPSAQPEATLQSGRDREGGWRPGCG